VKNVPTHGACIAGIPPAFSIFGSLLNLCAPFSQSWGRVDRERRESGAAAREKGGVESVSRSFRVLSGCSVPRNKEIMRVFRDLEIVEQLGSGVPRILKACGRDAFEVRDSFIRIVFRWQKADTPQGSPQVTPQVVVVLRSAKRTASASELQQATGLKDRVHFLKAYLEPLLLEEWIERTIPDKPRSSKQQYRLTEKGRAVLAAHKREDT